MSHTGVGGNFGVATTFELRIHPIGPIVYGGPMMWPAAQSPTGRRHLYSGPSCSVTERAVIIVAV